MVRIHLGTRQNSKRRGRIVTAIANVNQLQGRYLAVLLHGAERLSTVSRWYRNATSVRTYQTLKTGRQNINADYDVVAEAEAILAEAALATV